MPDHTGFSPNIRSPFHKIRRCFAIFLSILTLTACSLPQRTTSSIQVNIHVDGTDQSVHTTPGYTILQTINQAGISMSSLDRTDPAGNTLVATGLDIQIIRVTENYEISQVVIPFQEQTLTNESLPSGETRLIQPGEAGINEITTRVVSEDGIETSRHQVKTTVIKEAVPEITMVGIQEPFAAVKIPGRLAYLTAGTGWIMDGSTGLRKPVVSTGDLDGRVFALSPDGQWLLFTRKSVESGSGDINSLWAVSTVGSSDLIDLQVRNVIHFADFIPGTIQTIAYSTVEPRTAAPGWQANNDLLQLTFDASGFISGQFTLLAAGSGGIYGWWGTNFSWSNESGKILYSRPDGIGLVNLNLAATESLLSVIPYQTNSSWAWIPGTAWDSSGSIIYLTTHEKTAGIASGEDSPIFNLSALSLSSGTLIPLIQQSGMFAYPSLSHPGEEGGSQLAFLQAIFPDRSDTSSYRLCTADLDGSNQKVIFPRAGSTGLEPQTVVWSPGQTDNGNNLISLVYQGNIWLVDAGSGSSQQITGDGLTSRIDWQ